MNVTPQSRSATAGAGAAPLKQRFPRGTRLLKHAEFEQVYRQGRRHFSGHMTMFYLRRDQGGPRIGLTVGRVLGGSVERNRIRRRMREAVRLQLAGFSAPVDVVINPKKSVLQAEFAGIREELRRGFQVIAEKSGEKGPS